MRSIADVGREFRFPLGTDLLPIPTLNPDDNQVLFKQLWYMYTNSWFAISSLQIIIEERRKAHREHWNKLKQQQIFKLGDVLKAHIQGNSKAKTWDVKKLSYKAQWPFQDLKGFIKLWVWSTTVKWTQICNTEVQ